MKILQLRFKNLNSLYGEWIIDFTEPEYVANGLFVLTGPTGAGKSTILDAICLALYGATPRLGKITKSSNEIMSRQTGECYAEVLFESQAGRFRCHWEQRRARKKAEGKLQDQEHQIVDADTGKPVETKKSLVARVIEEKTGMDFDRFTRSILLAQGGFDTFLKANVEQKSKILEQITGTAIYSEISLRVHECQRDEHNKLNILNAETSGITLLAPEQEREIQEQLAVVQKQENEITARAADIGKAAAWLTAIDELKKEIGVLTDEAERLEADRKAFKPDRLRLDKAIRAASLEGKYAMLISLRKQQTDDQTALITVADRLPELEKSAHDQVAVLKEAELRTLQAKNELQTAMPLIQKIRFLDQKIVEQKTAVSEGVRSCERETAEIEKQTQRRDEELKKRSAAEKTLKTVLAYLEQNKRDEWLITGLAGVEEQFSGLHAKQQEIRQKKDEIDGAELAKNKALEDLESASKQCSLREKEVEDSGKGLQHGKERLTELLGGRLLREYHAEKDNLFREKGYIEKIMALTEHREKLEDGVPCPLCGATAHPFAEGNIPEPDEIEQRIESLTRLIAEIEEQRTIVEKLEQVETAARQKLNDSEKLVVNASHIRQGTEKTILELHSGLKKLRANVSEQQQSIADKLHPLGYVVNFSDPNSSISSLRSRMKKWVDQAAYRDSVEGEIAAVDSEVKRLNAVLEKQAEKLIEKQQDTGQLEKTLADGIQERKKLYGDKQPDDEEHRLNILLAEREMDEKKAHGRNAELQQKLKVTQNQLDSLNQRIEKRAPELNRIESDFSAELVLAGFPDEKTFVDARLTAEVQNQLSSRAQALDTAVAAIDVKRQDRKKRLAVEMEKKITDRTAEELQKQLDGAEESLKQLQHAIASFTYQLTENNSAKEQMKEKQSAIEAQRKECARIDKLHALIGSADGKKYRNFAQGLTFELMVNHANRQLEKMTDRYLLIRDEREPLELNVVDNYQAGEIRSTRNLSGGESFVVSLTLALGLSKMASRKVRVDSLFLDEGFGTLDEDSLETALETLAGLQQDGKLIGIISHVSALKERIRSQINIIPGVGGRSILIGPGCASESSRK